MAISSCFRCVDAEVADFMCDQMGLELELKPEAAAEMQAWLDVHPRRMAKAPKYVPEDFGLACEGLAKRFAAYRERRGYV